MPGVGGSLLNHAAALRNNLAIHNAEASKHQQSQFFPPAQNYDAFSPTASMRPPMMQDNGLSNAPFGHQPPVSSSFSMSLQQSMSTPSIGPPPPDSTTAIPQSWNGALFDPSDPALFNFDLASMNFGNHYGALEFGMLGHMATGAGETSPSDTTTQRGSVTQNGSSQYPLPLGSFSESPNAQQTFLYNDTVMSDWPRGGPNIYGQQFHRPCEVPHAFAIETNSANFTSPDSDSSPGGSYNMKLEDSPTSAFKVSPLPANPAVRSISSQDQQRSLHHRQHSHISTPQLKGKSQLPVKPGRRYRDPSSIYTSVTTPYSYTTGFHSLIAYLQRRFAASPSKTLNIAKSLASIRPSFIATTKTLNRADLIFMEKCFQRTLWEYEGFIEGVGTPTIVARRTGEIAAVGKEFSILTGWKKEVLLGRESNLNVNRGGNSGASSTAPGSGTNTAGRTGGANTPSQRNVRDTSEADSSGEKRLQPVFLAELLDDDSVVEFYEGFARLAFGDSRGSVMGRGKLLKYKTDDDQIVQGLDQGREMTCEDQLTSVGGRGPNPHTRSHRMGIGAPPKKHGEMKKGIADEKGMKKLGHKDGKVDCTYCWTVKRDVFDIPMLIVMNASLPFFTLHLS